MADLANLAASAMVLATVLGSGAAIAAEPVDPYAYMEEIEGAKALDFARAENARSLPRLQNDPRYGKLYDDALKAVTAKDRIPIVGFAGDGTLRNYWQDSDHVRGLWRSVDPASYRTATPAWKTILDLDALAKAEGANFVWKGADCLAPDDRLCLVSLSNGGKDAVEVREFDTQTGRFVDGGFHLPEGKHRFDWIDKDTLIVATEWTKGQVTTSGYPYVVKLLKRGQALADAEQVFTGKPDDGGYGVSPVVLRDPAGKVQAVRVSRPLDTFYGD
jgi:prolyl oligopeptidase